MAFTHFFAGAFGILVALNRRLFLGLMDFEGHCAVYPEGGFELIEPRMGTLVCVLVEDYWHEVLPAKKTRASISGWLN
ncbi:MAG: 2OG-Fe(II) oxygenase [Luteolibacter sp.]